MIVVRLISRTHYQILEPAYLIPLIRECTSPIRSSYRDVVARRFFEKTAGLNIAASGYAVDLARSLELLNSNLVWTGLGQLVNIVATNGVREPREQLSLSEKIVFFRLFLEYDGAALIFVAKKLEAEGQFPAVGESWASLAQELFLDTYDEYLNLTTDTLLRTRIRQLAEKRRHSPFKGHSGRHQLLIHANTLFRLGLVDSSNASSGRMYLAKHLAGRGRLATSELLKFVPDVITLEEIIQSQSLYEVVGRILGIKYSSRVIDDEEFISLVKRVYAQVMETGVNLCSLQTICEALQIQSLVLASVPESQTRILTRLRAFQKTVPSQIRFHVDRYGNPAYLKMELAG